MMLQPLELNLASRPFRNNTLVWLAHGAAVVGLVTLTVVNVGAFAEYRRDLGELRSDVASIEGRRNDLRTRREAAERGIKRHDVKYLSVQASRARDVLERKGLSWTLLFNRIEQVLPCTTRMTSLRPVFTFGSRISGRDEIPEGAIPVSVEGAARRLEDLLEFERNLIEDVHFSNVEPNRFSQEGDEIYFQLRFLYFPEATAEEPAEPVDAEWPEEGDLAAGAVEDSEGGDSAVIESADAQSADGGAAESGEEGR